jgi:hypothetical protein
VFAECSRLEVITVLKIELCGILLLAGLVDHGGNGFRMGLQVVLVILFPYHGLVLDVAASFIYTDGADHRLTQQQSVRCEGYGILKDHQLN